MRGKGHKARNANIITLEETCSRLATAILGPDHPAFVINCKEVTKVSKKDVFGKNFRERLDKVKAVNFHSPSDEIFVDALGRLKKRKRMNPLKTKNKK